MVSGVSCNAGGGGKGAFGTETGGALARLGNTASMGTEPETQADGVELAGPLFGFVFLLTTMAPWAVGVKLPHCFLFLDATLSPGDGQSAASLGLNGASPSQALGVALGAAGGVVGAPELACAELDAPLPDGDAIGSMARREGTKVAKVG
jgi:hypothetical protein